MPTVSLQTIAAATGFSRSTVGHVLAGRGDELKVAKSTQDVIRATADRLGYRRSFFAASLSKGRSDLLIVLGAVTGVPWRLARQTRVAQLLFERGHRVQLFDWRWGRAQPDRFFAFLTDLQPRGLIVSDLVPRQAPMFAPLMERGTVVVTGDGPRQGFIGLEADGVYLDRQAVAQTAMRHLIELGHRHIVCVQPDRRGAWELRDRWIGYRAALKAAGLPCDALRHVWPSERQERRGQEIELACGQAALPLLLELRPRPTAAVASNDRVATGLLKACSEMGVRVPEDLSIIGAEDDAVSAYLSQPLTTLRLPVDQMSEAAVALLERRLAGDRSPVQYTPVGPQLVVRATTAPPGANAVEAESRPAPAALGRPAIEPPDTFTQGVES